MDKFKNDIRNEIIKMFKYYKKSDVQNEHQINLLLNDTCLTDNYNELYYNIFNSDSDLKTLINFIDKNIEKLYKKYDKSNDTYRNYKNEIKEIINFIFTKK
jgi:hypothetical protein